jgi:hypothetical protein
MNGIQKGHLCATPATMVLCPDGFFWCASIYHTITPPQQSIDRIIELWAVLYSPPGTHIPKACGPMSLCPEGTSRRVYLGTPITLVVILFASLAQTCMTTNRCYIDVCYC